jgi:hypothetical protein
MNDIPWEFCVHLFKFCLLPQRNTHNFMNYTAPIGQWSLGGYNGLGIWLGLADRYTCKVTWKTLGTCLLGRLRRQEDNIKKEVRVMACEDWR